MTPMDEEAKAVQEVAKTAHKALELAERSGSFLSRVFGDLVEDAVGLVGDQIKYLRVRRYFDLQEKVEARLDQRGQSLRLRPVPPNFALPLIEYATLEENDELQTLWANLLADAMDGESGQEVRSAFISILKDLSSLDATILRYFHHGADDAISYLDKMMVMTERLARRFDTTPQACEIAVFNLMRLQCLSPARTEEGIVHYITATGISGPSLSMTITPLGRALVAACMQ